MIAKETWTLPTIRSKLQWQSFLSFLLFGLSSSAAWYGSEERDRGHRGHPTNSITPTKEITIIFMITEIHPFSIEASKKSPMVSTRFFGILSQSETARTFAQFVLRPMKTANRWCWSAGICFTASVSGTGRRRKTTVQYAVKMYDNALILCDYLFWSYSNISNMVYDFWLWCDLKAWDSWSRVISKVDADWLWVQQQNL